MMLTLTERNGKCTSMSDTAPKHWHSPILIMMTAVDCIRPAPRDGCYIHFRSNRTTVEVDESFDEVTRLVQVFAEEPQSKAWAE